MLTIVADARQHQLCQDGQAVTQVAGSPDGRYIAVAGYAGTVEVWDRRTGSLHVKYTGHTSVVTGVAWSPCSRFLASSSWDGTVHIWNRLSGERDYTSWQHRRHSPSARIKAVVWSRCGRFLASAATDWTIRVWRARTGLPIQVLSDHRGAVETIAWSRDNRHLASGGEDGTIRVWDTLLLPRPLLAYRAPAGGAICAVAWSPDHQSLAFLEAGRRVHVLHVPSCTLLWSQTQGNNMASGSGDEPDEHAASVGAIAFTPDGSHVASVGENGVGYLWHARTGACIAELHTGTELRTLAFLPNAVAQSTPWRLAAGSWDGTLSVWSLFADQHQRCS
jgi:WD40 repeat protein